MDSIEKFGQLMEDKDFQVKLEAAKTDEDVVALFEEEDIYIDMDEFKKYQASVANNTELTEKDLESAAGGVLGAITFFGGMAIKYAWGMTPGNTYQEKTKFIVDGWKSVFTKKKKKK